MTRLWLTFTAWLILAAGALATLTPRNESPLMTKEGARALAAKPLVRHLAQVTKPNTKTEFAVTDQTEIMLDGKACAYAQVPRAVSIVHMELAADNKTVLKIHFRSAR